MKVTEPTRRLCPLPGQKPARYERGADVQQTFARAPAVWRLERMRADKESKR